MAKRSKLIAAVVVAGALGIGLDLGLGVRAEAAGLPTMQGVDHVGLTVYEQSGVETLFGPLAVKEGPAAGQSIIYFKAPWGMQMELISYPRGMAYEKGSAGKLWSPKDQ